MLQPARRVVVWLEVGTENEIVYKGIWQSIKLTLKLKLKFKVEAKKLQEV